MLDDDGVVVETAPILRFTLGWDRQRLVDRFRQEWDSKVELVR